MSPKEKTDQSNIVRTVKLLILNQLRQILVSETQKQLQQTEAKNYKLAKMQQHFCIQTKYIIGKIKDMPININ